MFTDLLAHSDDDEEAATGLVGVMQAIVSIFADEGDKLRCVVAVLFAFPLTAAWWFGNSC